MIWSTEKAEVMIFSLIEWLYVSPTRASQLVIASKR